MSLAHSASSSYLFCQLFEFVHPFLYVCQCVSDLHGLLSHASGLIPDGRRGTVSQLLDLDVQLGQVGAALQIGYWETGRKSRTESLPVEFSPFKIFNATGVIHTIKDFHFLSKAETCSLTRFQNHKSCAFQYERAQRYRSSQIKSAHLTRGSISEE